VFGRDWGDDFCKICYERGSSFIYCTVILTPSCSWHKIDLMNTVRLFGDDSCHVSCSTSELRGRNIILRRVECDISCLLFVFTFHICCLMLSMLVISHLGFVCMWVLLLNKLRDEVVLREVECNTATLCSASSRWETLCRLLLRVVWWTSGTKFIFRREDCNTPSFGDL
jgi:hypothetical protein